MPVQELQDRLRATIPQSTDAPLARAVREGVFLADDLFSEGAFLNNLLGQDLRGHVRRVGIAYQILAYCQRGDLPFSAEVRPMPKGPWHWLEIRSTSLLAHICRTEDVFAFPEEAESRQDLRLSIQPDLLSWSVRNRPFADILKTVSVLYAWLTYRINGDGTLSHLCWVSPAPDADEWLAHINVLQEAARVEAPSLISPVPDPTEKLRFKDHIRQAFNQSTDLKSSGD